MKHRAPLIEESAEQKFKLSIQCRSISIWLEILAINAQNYDLCASLLVLKRTIATVFNEWEQSQRTIYLSYSQSQCIYLILFIQTRH